MNKTSALQGFIQQRIAQLQSKSKVQDLTTQLDSVAMQTAFSNILHFYFGSQEELGNSYLMQARTYFEACSWQQASFYCQLAIKYLQKSELVEQAKHLMLRSMLQMQQIEQANEFIQDLNPQHNMFEHLTLQAEIRRRLGDQNESERAMSQLTVLVQQQHSKKSTQMGRLLIEKGKNKGYFKKYDTAVCLMQEGIDVLIDLKEKDHQYISGVYKQMAEFSRQLGDLDRQYTCLICEYSMVRQAQVNEKNIIEVLHKIVTNLVQREEYEQALKQLLKVQVLQRRIYGESSAAVGKTLKDIADIMLKLNRSNQAKKYEQECSRILNCNDRKGMSKDRPLNFSQVRKN